MNNNSSNNGPYKHFKRPEQGRVQQSKPKKAHHFVKWVIGLVIVVLVGVPVYLTFNHKSSSSVASSSSSELRTYVVQDGDSLSSIAAAHGMSVDTLARLNNITDATSIRAGETLKLN